jgi:dTDP-4-amino-4,6-dideoxygalactose transaminase
LKNFGFVDETTVVAAGINGKMSEFNASLGLLQLKKMPQVLAARQAVDKAYRHLVRDIRGVVIPVWPESATVNWSYFPIRITPDYPVSRDDLYAQLKCRGIHGRRYFYPLISEFPMYRNSPSAQQGNLPQACQASREVICLPQHTGLSYEDIERIVGAIGEIACENTPLLKAA